MLNEKLKEIRIEKGLSQEKMAKLLNISRQALGHFEKGDRQINIELVKKICVLFDLSADELLEIETLEERKRVIINNSFNNNSGKQNIKF